VISVASTRAREEGRLASRRAGFREATATCRLFASAQPADQARISPGGLPKRRRATARTRATFGCGRTGEVIVSASSSRSYRARPREQPGVSRRRCGRRARASARPCGGAGSGPCRNRTRGRAPRDLPRERAERRRPAPTYDRALKCPDCLTSSCFGLISSALATAGRELAAFRLRDVPSLKYTSSPGRGRARFGDYTLHARRGSPVGQIPGSWRLGERGSFWRARTRSSARSGARQLSGPRGCSAGPGARGTLPLHRPDPALARISCPPRRAAARPEQAGGAPSRTAPGRVSRRGAP